MKIKFNNFKVAAKRGTVVAALTLSAIVLSNSSLKAEGYQVNAQSAKQMGMGHTGVALKLGAESMLFNPAGLSYMDSKFHISLGTTAISSKVTYTKDSYTSQTDNPISTPIFGYIGYKVSENLAVGVSLTNPVGNSLNWDDNWAGSTLIQDISLKGYSVQPTISYKFGDFISIGAGLMIDFGSFELSRALIAEGGLDAIGTAIPLLSDAISSFAGETPLSVKLNGTAKVNYGVNVGVMVDVSPKVSIGASYRSKVNFTAEEGTAELIYANENVSTVIATANQYLPESSQIVIPSLDKGTFTATLPAPSNVNLGVSYTPIKDLILTAELQRVGWQAYDSLNIVFDENLAGYTIEAEKDYKSTLIYRVGAEYKLCNLATVRLGGYYDTTPVRSDLYNPETPGSNKICITAGTSIRPTNYLSIDIALAYTMGADTYGSYTDKLTGETFDGNYKASAFMPALGLSFKF